MTIQERLAAMSSGTAPATQTTQATTTDPTTLQARLEKMRQSGKVSQQERRSTLPTATPTLPTQSVGQNFSQLLSDNPASKPVAKEPTYVPSNATQSFYEPTTQEVLADLKKSATAGKTAVTEGVKTGYYGLASSVTGAADLTLGNLAKLVGWKDNPWTKRNEYIQGKSQTVSQEAAQKLEGTSGANKALYNVTSGVTGALPQAGIALATAGLSMGAQATTAGLQAISSAAGATGISGLASTISTALQSMMKSPNYWTAFTQVAGQNYNEARADGANELKATTFATVNGLINAIVEIGGGGIQELPTALKSGNVSLIRQWVDTMIDEGKEEVVQGIIERLAQNVTYNKGNATFSTTDPNAILNPVTSLKEGAMGAAVGGVLGSGQIAANSITQGVAAKPTTQSNITTPQTFTQNTIAPNLPKTQAVGSTQTGSNVSAIPTLPTSQTAQNMTTAPTITPQNANGVQPSTQTNANTPRIDFLGQGGIPTLGNAQTRNSTSPTSTNTAQNGTQTQGETFESRKAAFNERAQRYNELLQGIMERGTATEAEYEMLETEGAALNSENAALEQEQRVSNNQVSRLFNSPSNHIDRRTNDSVKNPSVKAFQFDHPQLHQYFVEAAQLLQAEVSAAQMVDAIGVNKKSKQSAFFRSKYSGPVLDAVNLGLTKNEILKCCEDIIKNNGQENYAAAKRIERILDAMLTNGFVSANTQQVEANNGYVSAKEQIAGAERESERRNRQSSEIDEFLSLVEGETTALPQGTGAASRNSLGGMGATKPTRFDINDQMDVDLDNLPQMSNQVNMTPQPKTGNLKTKLDGAYTGIVDTLNPIVRFSKAANDNTAMLASNSRNAGGTVSHIIGNSKTGKGALVDMDGNEIGVSLKELVERIPQKQQVEFWNYMMQRRNANRAAMDTNVIANYNSRMSKRYVENVEAQHPEWKPIGDDIVQWLRDFSNAWSVDSGLVDAAIMHNLQNADPDYIPAQREFSETEAVLTGGEVGRKFVDQRSPIKKMQGSERDINNPVENIMRLVNTTVKTARYNQVGQSLLNTLRTKPMPQYAEIISEEEAKAARGNNVVSVIENGQKQYLRINDVSLLQALEGMPKSTFTVPVISGFNQAFKNLVTQQNPLFGITNLMRDIPTGYIYGSQWNPFSYLMGEVKAFGQIASGKESYRRYKAVGGGMSSFFSSANAETAALNLAKTKNVFQKVGTSFEKFNTMIEEATRLNEFNAVFSKTGDVQKALNAANDVTVNFARGGNITKTVDRNLVPYLNASVQGLDKLAKAFSPQKILKTLLTGAIGITLPNLLLYLFNRDNPYYDELSNRTKDTYFCIPNLFGDMDDNGNPMTFIKIPKAREVGMIFGSLAERIARAVDGDEEAFKGFGGTLATNISPTDPMDSGLIGPIVGLRSNEDFAGRTIVPQSMQDRSPHLQYDEKTSELTKYIAEYASKAGIELSPKQMDYLIDSWTGVVGDFLLPLTTQGANALSPITNRFMADSRYSSQVITNFYDKMDEAAQKANDRNFAEGLDSDIQTIEEKVSSNFTRASKEISALSKVSNRAGIGQLTSDDKALLREYGISTTGKPEDIQKAIRSQQIEIAREAIGRGERASEMELDLNNNSDIANKVETYQSAGLSQKAAYNLYKTLDALKPTGDNTSVTTLQKVQTIAKQSYTQKQKTALVASLYTDTSKESLLTDLSISDNLISRYLTTEDTDFVNMTVPASFTESSVEYELTDKERQLFRSTYTEYFNARANSVMSDDALKRLRDKAYDAAKKAVLRGRR